MTEILYSILLLLGLATPFSPLVSVLNTIIFGLILSANSKKFRPFLIISLFVAFSLIYLLMWPGWLSLIQIPLLALTYFFSRKFLPYPKKLVYITLFLLCLFLATFAFLNGGNIRQELKSDPGEIYTTDMRGFLKTYYLMKQGLGFYRAYPVGMAGGFHGSFFSDVLIWRQPLVFYLWQILPGKADSIYYLGTILLTLSLVGAFVIAKQFLPEEIAIITPFILAPYFLLPLSDLAILQPEWWGLGFLIIGLAFYFRNHVSLAGIIFALCLAIRETFLIVIGALVVIDFFRYRSFSRIFRLSLPLVLFAGYFLFYHMAPIPKNKVDFFRNFSLDNWRVINVAFAYSSWNYAFGVFRPFVLCFFTTTSLLLLSLLRRKFIPALILLSFYLPVLAASIFSAINGRMSVWHDYWGIYFVPLLLIATPIALASLSATRSQE